MTDSDSEDSRRDMVETRQPYRQDDSVVVTIPKEQARKRGLIDENGEPVEGVVAKPYVRGDDAVGIEVRRAD